MKYTVFHDYKVSQLSLGTIQLGMDYGIANSGGAPDEEEAFHILDAARRSGINTFDSARTYGRAEEILGHYFSQKPASGDLLISKFKYDWEPGITIDKAWQRTKASITQSAGYLKTDRIPMALYHKGPSEPMEEVLRIAPAMIERLRENGLIDYGGLSLYYSDDARYLKEDTCFEAVQIPLNVLDQAIIREGILEDLHRSGKLIFIRSVFLQGLFFRDPKELKGVLRHAIPYLERLHALAARYDLSVAAAAFGFIRDLPEADSLVIGAENPRQIYANLELLNGPALSETLSADLAALSIEIPKEVVTPGLWV